MGGCGGAGVFMHIYIYIYIYIYVYIYIQSFTDRLFRSIRTLQFGQTRRTLEAGIETCTTLRQTKASDHTATREFLGILIFSKQQQQPLFTFFHTLPATRELNSFEEPCITLTVADNSFARELNPHGGAYIYIYIYIYIVSSWLSGRILDQRFSQQGFDPSFGNLACLATLKRYERTKQSVDEYIYIYIYIYIYMCVCVCVCVCLCVCVCVCIRLEINLTIRKCTENEKSTQSSDSDFFY